MATRELAAPVASSIELQMRLDDFKKTFQRTRASVAQQLQTAASDLARDRDIDFSSELQNLLH